jgi:hypothetical protein
MTDVAAMLNAYPGERPQVDEDTLVICIQEALNCAQACTSCADACSADPSAAHLAQCGGAALNCADMATAVVRVFVQIHAVRPGRDRGGSAGPGRDLPGVLRAVPEARPGNRILSNLRRRVPSLRPSVPAPSSIGVNRERHDERTFSPSHPRRSPDGHDRHRSTRRRQPAGTLSTVSAAGPVSRRDTRRSRAGRCGRRRRSGVPSGPAPATGETGEAVQQRFDDRCMPDDGHPSASRMSPVVVLPRNHPINCGVGLSIGRTTDSAWTAARDRPRRCRIHAAPVCGCRPRSLPARTGRPILPPRVRSSTGPSRSAPPCRPRERRGSCKCRPGRC